MDKQQRWIEGIKKLPTWVGGAIGLATAIITFVILLQKNLYLGTIILGMLLAGAVLCLCVYLTFAKTPPLIEGGRGRYRFGNHRYWGIAGIVFSIVIISLTLALEPSRSFVVTAFTGTATPTSTPTPTSTLTPTPTQVPPCASIPDDELQITCLIEAEAEAVLFQNIDRAMAIFREDAIVRDVSGEEWEGSIAIRDRYESLIEIITFKSLQHNIVELDITENEATAKTALEAEYSFRPGLYTEVIAAQLLGLSPINKCAGGVVFETTGKEVVHIASEERWTFVKSQGIWKVKTLVYGFNPIFYHCFPE